MAPSPARTLQCATESARVDIQGFGFSSRVLYLISTIVDLITGGAHIISLREAYNFYYCRLMKELTIDVNSFFVVLYQNYKKITKNYSFYFALVWKLFNNISTADGLRIGGFYFEIPYLVWI